MIRRKYGSHSCRGTVTAQIRRDLTLWRAGNHGRAEIFALPFVLFAPFCGYSFFALA